MSITVHLITHSNLIDVCHVKRLTQIQNSEFIVKKIISEYAALAINITATLQLSSISVPLALGLNFSFTFKTNSFHFSDHETPSVNALFNLQF